MFSRTYLIPRLWRTIAPFLAWAIAACLTSSLSAQSTAALSGVVQDPTHAAVAHAQVQVLNQATSQTLRAESDSSGRFTFPELPVGDYILSVQASGFAHFQLPGIHLDADQKRETTVLLSLSQTSQSVEVKEAVTQVDTSGATLRNIVDERRINDLPLNGRNPLQLQLVVPGAVPNNSLAVSLSQNNPVSVNGSRGNENNYLLDGGDNNDPLTNSPSLVPNPDALEEFSILTNSYSAEYGRNSGAIVNAITKSGTNDLHGSLYEFVRNDDFDARNFFSLTKPILKRNQFGASLGGPVSVPKLYSGRNRTFFFLSYEGLREADASTVSGSTVPTALEREGNFSKSKKKPVDPITGAAFPNNIIPASSFDPAAVNFLTALIPLPNGPNGQLIYNAPTQNSSDQGLGRIDQLIGDKQHLTLRGFQAHDFFTDNGGLPLLNGQSEFDNTNVAANYTYAISPNLLNSAQFTFGRVILNRGPLPVGDGITYPDLGVNTPEVTPQYPTDFRGSVSGYWTMSQDNEVVIDRRTYEGSDSLAWTHGAHSLKFGADVRFVASDRVTANLTDPQFAFTGQFSGNGFADFLLGLPNTMQQGSLRTNQARSKAWSLYAQDDWKITSRLTLSLGLRYDPFYPFYDAGNQLSVFRPGQQSTLFPQAPNGLLYGGDPGVPPGGVPNDLNNFAPRAGFAWQPTSDGKWSVRGGYGIFYETPNFYELTGFANTQPYSEQVTINQPASFSNPYAGQIVPFPYNPPTTAAGRAAYQFVYPVQIGETVDANLVDAYVQQWNVNLQRELPGNAVVTAAYVGSKGTHLPVQVELNPALYAPGATSANVNARRIYQGFGSIDDYASIADSTYHALQISLNKRFSHGFSVLASYTFSKSLDNSSTDSSEWQNPLNLSAEKGLSDFDVPQRFVGSFIWNLPSPSKRLERAFLGGWQLNGIVTVQSGTPFTLVTGQDRALSGTGTQRPNLIGDPYVTGQTISEWYNPAAYALPAIGTYGDVGRNTLLGPGLADADLSVFREFGLTERAHLQFRAEAFNALNHANFSNPVANITSANAGRVLSASDPRILQFALKLRF